MNKYLFPVQINYSKILFSHTMHPFSNSLLTWHRENARDLPWKESKDPYRIWISEIILQQTRVVQGTPYYLKFIDRFPDVFALANATEDEVMKYWEGLGYYSRARNLHFSAQKIVHDYNGIFPTTYAKILELKGVGPYTAAAVSSFAFDLPHAVVDGNVYRVLARFFGIEKSIDESKTKIEMAKLAQELLPQDRPADFNQAIMDFGATVCTPDNPLCLFCPLRENCLAWNNGKTESLPLRSKKIKKRERFLHFLLFKEKDSFLIRKRNQGIWKGLYELPMIEKERKGEILSSLPKETLLINSNQHLLTHQKLHLYFYQLSELPSFLSSKCFLRVPIHQWVKYSYPKPILRFLKDYF
jgi:A/G-specific adenine glycosylase